MDVDGEAFVETRPPVVELGVVPIDARMAMAAASGDGPQPVQLEIVKAGEVGHSADERRCDGREGDDETLGRGRRRRI